MHFFEKKCGNILSVSKKAVPLHSLSGTTYPQCSKTPHSGTERAREKVFEKGV